MAKATMELVSFVGKLLEDDDVDVLREGVWVLAQTIMGADVSAQIGAGLRERSPDRTAHRNGYSTRTWDTTVGTIELRVPKITPGTYISVLLDPWRRTQSHGFQIVVHFLRIVDKPTKRREACSHATGTRGTTASIHARTGPTRVEGRHHRRSSLSG